MENPVRTNFQKGKTVHIILLILSIGIVMATNSYFEDQVMLAGNLIYIPATIVLVASSIYFLLEFRKKINMLALVSIVGFTVSVFAAEMIWMAEEMILQIEPFPSSADIFYILGYPFLLVFLYIVGKSTKVPKQIQIISGSVGLIFLIPTMVAAITIYGNDPFEFLLAGTYTIFDALLIWMTLNSVLTINNKQNFFWALMFIGLALLLIADSFFIVLAISDEYYTGHQIETLFLSSYIVISYGLYYQARTSKIKSHETIEELFNPIKLISTNFVQNLILISSSVVIMIAVSLILVLGIEEFTTNQATAFITIMASSVLIVGILSTLTYVLGKKLDRLKQLKKKYEENLPTEEIHLTRKTSPDYPIQVLLTRIEHLEKSNKRTGMITLTSVLLTTIVMGSYISENFFDLIPGQEELQSGKYLMETKQGVGIDKAMIWKITSGEPLQVDIVNSDLVSQDKIDAIKDAILSEGTIEIPNSELGKMPEDAIGTYYLGWSGALRKAAESQTAYYVPTSFQVVSSDESVGDISIILSDQKQLTGIISNTKTIVDENEDQIIKAYITIFDVKNLKADDFDLITKHEFIRAIGHANHLTSDLVSPINSQDSYISDCDVLMVRQLYGENQNNPIICEK